MKKVMIKFVALIVICLIATTGIAQEEKKTRLQKLRQIINSGSEFAPTNESYDEKNGGSEVKYEGNTEWTCTTKTVKASAGAGGDSGFPMVDPNADIIYPGNMIQGATLDNSTPDPIIIERGSGAFSINIYDGNQNSRVEVESVTKSEVTAAINEIISGSTGVVPSNFNITIKSIESREQFAMELGMKVNTKFSKLEGKLGYKAKSKRSSFLVKMTQGFYAISYDLPTSVDKLFNSSTRPAELRKYVSPNNPACYISNVNYGRIFYMLIESNSSKTEMEAKVKGAFNGVVYDVKGELKIDKLSQLKDVSYSVFAYGGDSQSTLRAVGVTDMTKLMDMLAKSSTIGSAKPLSYVVRSAKTGKIVSTQLATEYDVVDCKITGAKGTLPSIAHWTGHPLLKEFGGVTAAYADGPDRFVLINAKGEWLRSTVDVNGNGKLEGPFKIKNLPFNSVGAASKLKGSIRSKLYVFNGTGTKYATLSPDGTWSQIYNLNQYFKGDCPFVNTGVGALAYGGNNNANGSVHSGYNHWMFNASGQNYTRGYWYTTSSTHFSKVYNIHRDWGSGIIGDKIDGTGAAIGFKNGQKHTIIQFNKAGTQYIVYGSLTGRNAEVIGPFNL